MKKLFIACALCVLCGSITGCAVTTFDATKADGTKVHVTNTRVLWTTDSYAASIANDSASLSANKSSVDKEALAAVIQGAVQGAAAAAKP